MTAIDSPVSFSRTIPSSSKGDKPSDSPPTPLRRASPAFSPSTAGMQPVHTNSLPVSAGPSVYSSDAPPGALPEAPSASGFIVPFQGPASYFGVSSLGRSRDGLRSKAVRSWTSRNRLNSQLNRKGILLIHLFQIPGIQRIEWNSAQAMPLTVSCRGSIYRESLSVRNPPTDGVRFCRAPWFHPTAVL